MIGGVGGGVLAMAIGYLLGAIPSAYIVARQLKGKDIRKLGSGTVGAYNTYREVGARAGITVVIADIAKGIAAIAMAHQLGVALPFVLATGLATIAGHMWMPFLKFRGGMGMGTAVGVMAILLPLYGYWPQLVIFFGVIGVLLLVTRNIALAALSGFLALPVIIWLGTRAIPFTILAAAVLTMLWLKFLPTARTAWAKARKKRDFFFSDSLRLPREK